MVTIQTIQQLNSDILNDLQSQYSITITLFGKVFLRAIAGVQAGKLKLYYLGLGNIQKNLWPDTADSVTIGGTLERAGLIKIGRTPFSAVSAQYTVKVSGLPGAVIPGYGKTQFISDASSLNPNMLFTLDNSYTCTGANDFITVRALTPGTISQLNTGDTLTATAPITNVVSTGNIVTAQVVQPLDAETIEAYRKAVLFSFQSQPQGGSGTDYILWASAIQDVAAVYPYATSGQSNEISLYIESDIAESTDGHGTPSSTMLFNVEGYIEGAFNNVGKRPLGIFLINYLPVTPLPVTVNITGANPAFTATQQAAIIDSITTWVNTVRPYIASAYPLSSKNDIIDINNLISQTLNAAPGTSFGAVTFTVNGTQFNSYNFLLGFIPYITTITFS